jgi:hypothetical protein
MSSRLKRIKDEIMAALQHAEAEDGLYFNNLIVVHEDEERPIVSGEEEEVRQALAELTSEGKIKTEKTAESEIYHLA